jgi:hypothetical protein
MSMSAEDLEQYESELELQLYREYKDVVGIFTYAVETERRFYLCNAMGLGHVSSRSVCEERQGSYFS